MLDKTIDFEPVRARVCVMFMYGTYIYVYMYIYTHTDITNSIYER
jgi:hypothetical protein